MPVLPPGEAGIDSFVVGRLIAKQFPQWVGLPIARVRSAGTDKGLG